MPQGVDCSAKKWMWQVMLEVRGFHITGHQTAFRKGHCAAAAKRGVRLQLILTADWTPTNVRELRGSRRGSAVLRTCHGVAAEATNLLPRPAGLSSMRLEMLNWNSSLARWTLRRGTPPPFPTPPATQRTFLTPSWALPTVVCECHVAHGGHHRDGALAVPQVDDLAAHLQAVGKRLDAAICDLGSH